MRARRAEERGGGVVWWGWRGGRESRQAAPLCFARGAGGSGSVRIKNAPHGHGEEGRGGEDGDRARWRVAATVVIKKVFFFINILKSFCIFFT
jgi:hypothetical protein